MLPAAGSDREPPAYLREISRFACATRFEDLPSGVVERAKRLTADLFAIVTAGNQSEELKALARSRLRGLQGLEVARFFGHPCIGGVCVQAARVTRRCEGRK